MNINKGREMRSTHKGRNRNMTRKIELRKRKTIQNMKQCRAKKEGVHQLQQKAKEGGKQKQPIQKKEEEWHTQRNKSQKFQDKMGQREVWRPTRNTSQATTEYQQSQVQQEDMSSNHQNNIFNNLTKQVEDTTTEQEATQVGKQFKEIRTWSQWETDQIGNR